MKKWNENPDMVWYHWIMEYKEMLRDLAMGVFWILQRKLLICLSRGVISLRKCTILCISSGALYSLLIIIDHINCFDFEFLLEVWLVTYCTFITVSSYLFPNRSLNLYLQTKMFSFTYDCLGPSSLFLSPSLLPLHVKQNWLLFCYWILIIKISTIFGFWAK